MKRFKRPEPPAPVVAEEDEEHKAAMVRRMIHLMHTPPLISAKL